MPFPDARPPGGRRERAPLVPNERYEVESDAFMRYPELTIRYNQPIVNC